MQPEMTRRSFLQGVSTGLATSAAVAQTAGSTEPGKPAGRVLGPGPVPILLRVNGRAHSIAVEPRVTLLDALRNRLNLTGAKEVCNRASCGGCTVLLDGKPVYACMMLALDAQDHEVTTVEALAKGGKLTKVQQAFVEHDAMMCGFCTPGFVMTVTALLQRNPKPTYDEVRAACGGHVCRCGTYPFVFQAALKASGQDPRKVLAAVAARESAPSRSAKGGA